MNASTITLDQSNHVTENEYDSYRIVMELRTFRAKKNKIELILKNILKIYRNLKFATRNKSKNIKFKVSEWSQMS